MRHVYSRFIPLLASSLVLLAGTSMAAVPSETDDVFTVGAPANRPATRGEQLLQGGGGEQILAHLAARNDGTAWLSWYHQAPNQTTYSLRLQRIDTEGHKHLGKEGILASVVDSDSWVTDYTLLTAKNGDAILAYGNTTDYTMRLQRFDERGRSRWGAKGVVLTDPGMWGYEPNAVLCGDGSVVVAWSYESATDRGVALQRVSPSGTVQWAVPQRIHGSDGNSAGFPKVIPAGTSDVIVAWLENGGPASGNAMVQRFDRWGRAVWPVTVQLNCLDPLPFVLKPELVSDGAGGAFAAWSLVKKDLSFEGLVQHVRADGTVAWDPRGASVSNNPEMSHVISALSLIHGHLVVAWREMDKNQNGSGIFVQAYDPNGLDPVGQFGPQGMALFDPMDPVGARLASIRPSPGGMAVFYASSQNFPFDATAAVATVSLGLPDYWPGDTTLSPVASAKSDPAVSADVDGGYWIAWTDFRVDTEGSDIWGAYWKPPHSPHR